jgi:hypothetical protein
MRRAPRFLLERDMNIDLSKRELALLIDLLQEKWEQLRVQIRRTETPRFHDELRELERATVALLRRLEGAAAEHRSA